MEKIDKILFIVILCALIMVFPRISIPQSQIDSSSNELSSINPIIPISQLEETATFFQTFLRTPFAILSIIFTFFGILCSGIFELFAYLLNGFDYEFPVTKEIISIGWKGTVQRWWWQPSVTWHLIVSFFLWIVILSSGKKKKMEK